MPDRAGRLALAAAVAPVVTLAGAMTVAAVMPDSYVRALRRLTPPAPDPTPLDAPWGRFRCRADEVYPSAHPGNRFDIYGPRTPGELRPLCIFVHGGGFALGDKSIGAGRTRIVSASAAMIDRLLNTGFTVVSTKYARAPDRRYPTPVVQLGDLVAHLRSSAEEFGIDAERVVLAGSSAGGHIVAQYALVQTDHAYAADVGIAPTLPPEHLRALYLGSALLSPARISRLTAPATWRFLPMAKAYFGAADLRSSPEARQADVIEHVDAHFPPTCLVDGNTGTFTDQALALRRRLDGLAVPVQALIHGPGDGRIGHAFDLTDTPEATAALDVMTRFLSAAAGGSVVV